MKRAAHLLMLFGLPLLLSKANATIIVATSSDLQACGAPGQAPCPTPPRSTFNGGLIINGDFGDGNFTGFSGTATQNSDISQSGVQGNANNPPSSAYLASSGMDQTLYQTFATTPGDMYSISFNLDNFDQMSELSPTYDFSVDFGNQVLLSFANPSYPDTGTGAATTFTFQAAATGSATSLLFTARNDPGAFFLTDIAVRDSGTPLRNDIVAVSPEPGSLVLLGTGLLGIVGAAKRRARPTRQPLAQP